MTKWYFSHILEPCTTQTVHICVHKEKFWHLKVSQTVVVVYYTMMYTEESESKSVEDGGGESKVACCQALCSPKAEKAYTQQTLCSVLYHALFSLCSILLSHTYIISLLYLVKYRPQHSYQAVKYQVFFFVSFYQQYGMLLAFFYCLPQVYSCEIFIGRPAAMFVYYKNCCIIYLHLLGWQIVKMKTSNVVKLLAKVRINVIYDTFIYKLV